MNVRIPEHVARAIDQLAKTLGVSKTDVIAAVLNEGLSVAAKKHGAQRRK